VTDAVDLADIARQFCTAAEAYARSATTEQQNQMRVQRVLMARALLFGPASIALSAAPEPLTAMVSACLKSGLRRMPRIDVENQILALCQAQDLAKLTPDKAATSGLAALLLCGHAYELGLDPDLTQVPPSLRPIWLAFLFEAPPTQRTAADDERYAAYLDALRRRVGDSLSAASAPPAQPSRPGKQKQAQRAPALRSGPADAKRQAELSKHFAAAVQHHQNERLAEAEPHYRQVLKLDPGNGPALNNLGLLVASHGKRDEAEALYRKAIEHNADYADAHMNLGNLLMAQGKTADAIACYEASLRVSPKYANAHVNLGNAYRSLGKVDEAIACYEEALRIDPNMADALIDMGTLYNRLRRASEAVKYFERAVAMRPDSAAAHNNLACTLLDLGRHDEALPHLQESIRLKPDNLDAYLNLGNMLTDLGRNDEAAAQYRKILAIDPDRSSALCNSVFSMNYSDKVEAKALAEQHFNVGRRIEQSFLSAHPTFRNSADRSRKLRIGYVSPDLRMHAVAFFLEPLIREHDRNQVEIFCYAEVFAPDGMSAKLQSMVDHWFSTVGVTDDDLAARIKADGIDILVDLAGHSAHNRLPVFARRPAPVQMTWLGYPNTTGMKTMDYRLVDSATDPEGVADPLASETLVRIEGGLWCYQPLPQAPDPAPPPCATTGKVTFGSFNNLAKLSPTVFDLWSQLMKRVPGSRIVLKTRYFAAPGTRASVLARFTDRGIDADRVSLLEGLPDLVAHLATYNQIDIGLDSLPYNGTTTTCEALWMGVPVVTLAGDRHLARVGASLLTRVGAPELIAPTPAEYVEIAAKLAGDIPRLTKYHAELRSRMKASPLCDAPGFARRVEGVYRDLWQRWCDSAAGGAPKVAVAARA
jgi:protein O-GlcNAc transferase